MIGAAQLLEDERLPVGAGQGVRQEAVVRLEGEEVKEPLKNFLLSWNVFCNSG
jgi:hypothetical protein